MNIKRLGLVITAAVAIATSGWAQSESMRPLFTRENRFPETGKAEIGTFVNYAQYDEYFVSQMVFLNFVSGVAMSLRGELIPAFIITCCPSLEWM